MLKILNIASFILISLTVAGQQLTPAEIVRKSDEKFNGEKSGISTMEMIVIRPTWQRNVEFKSWSKGKQMSLTLITAPARDQGQSFLKLGNEMWSWNPTISRLIKLPPSMMSQGWMGSDYTNDDILKESSVVSDYTHELKGEETISGHTCYKILMTVKPEAKVVWGKQIWWVDKEEFNLLKAEIYDEDGSLVRTELASEIKTMDGRKIPTRLELIPAEEKGNKTVVIIKDIKFNVPIEDSFFSQQNMKRVR